MNGEPAITRAMAREYASLDDPKGRRRAGIFVAEGLKCVQTLLDGGFEPHCIYTDAKNPAPIPGAVPVPRAALREITRLGTTPSAIGFFRLPEPLEKCPADPSKELILALDRIQDPGNLGTIIRTADWMGVHTIVASPDTVDAFNPKAVQASMGAIASVKVFYTPLPPFLEAYRNTTAVYGTLLEGSNIYTAPLSAAGIVVMGNEGSGLSPEVAAALTHRLLIPPFGGRTVSESLNVATATAIVLSQFRQRLANG